MSLISATEAVRRFSEIINNVRYRGEQYTVVRGGQPVATIAPVAGPAPARRLGELPALVQALPRLAPDDTSFTDDVLAATAAQPLMPRAPGWE
jgi:prevent-host-death family protein